MTNPKPPSFEQFLQQSIVSTVQSKLGGAAGAGDASGDASTEGSHTTTAKLQQYVVSKLRPWGAFFDTKKFRLPTGACGGRRFKNGLFFIAFPLTAPTVSDGGPQRVVQNFGKNLSYWSANYVVSAMVLSLLAVLSHPSFLFVSLVLGGAWLYSSMYMADQTFTVAGRSITVGMRERSIALTAVSVVVCYLADVGSTLLWIVGFCVVSIVLHALFRESEEIASEADFV